VSALRGAGAHRDYSGRESTVGVSSLTTMLGDEAAGLVGDSERQWKSPICIEKGVPASEGRE
jgi:hypothetical protein